MSTAAPAAPTDLDVFVRAAKAGGVEDASLVPLLRNNGWPERRIYASLGSYYGDKLALRPPARGTGVGSARDAFLYLLNFITLGCWTIALGQIFYTLIDNWLPGSTVPYAYRGPLVHQMSFALAQLIVAFPSFVAIHAIIAVGIRKRPGAAESGVRAWLTYLALVIASSVILGDGIWFLYDFLSGDLTARFVLQALVVATIGGGVLAYYLAALRDTQESES